MLAKVLPSGAHKDLVARDYDATLLQRIDVHYLAGYCDGRLSIYPAAMSTGFPQVRARISTQQVGVIARLNKECQLGTLCVNGNSTQLMISARREIAALCRYIAPHIIVKLSIVDATLRFIDRQDTNEAIRGMIVGNYSQTATRAWEAELREGIKDLYDIGLEMQAYNRGEQ